MDGRLTPEMMDILIAEYYLDPEDLGYRKYGYMEKEGEYVFYVPQILALINEPRTKKLDLELVTEDTDEAFFTSKYYIRALPSRLNNIFNGLEGAPNALSEMDLIQSLYYFVTNNPWATIAGIIIIE